MKTLMIALITIMIAAPTLAEEQVQVAAVTVDVQPVITMTGSRDILPEGDQYYPARYRTHRVPRPGDREFVAWSRTPELVRALPPEYPKLAREAGAEGRILLSVTVGCYGNVEAVAVLHSDVTPSMEKAAIAAAARFEFEPAMQRDMPVRSQMAVPVWFRLR
jgi:TonB family protein